MYFARLIPFQSIRTGATFAAIALSVASAQVPGPALGPRPAGDVRFEAQPGAAVGGKYEYGLCLGGPLLPKNGLCGGPLNAKQLKVSGGNPPYHFMLDPGVGFPPFGIHLDLNGNLTGKLSKGARGGTFRVCAVDQSASQSCQTMTINPASAAGTNAAGTSHALRNTLIVVGLGAGAGAGIAAACSGGKCGGAGGGSCVSSRSCIVNSVAGGCECAGATSGYCGVSGPVAQSGQACGNGTACASGLSCNNGICEGPNGRCPF
jgi:hypothetical protein